MPASPFEPALRAMLLTGTGASIPLGPGAGVDELGKVPGRHLAPYLRPEPIAA